MTAENRLIEQRADEYVLGLLEPGEEVALEASLLNGDVQLQRAVAQSRDMFVELDMTAKQLPVTELMWTNIFSRINVMNEQSELEVPAAANTRVADNNNDRPFWRWLALAGVAATLALAIQLTWSITQHTDAQVIAVLVDDKGQSQAVVEDYGNRSTKVTLLSDFEIPDNSSIEVWTLPSAELGAVSLGLLQSSVSTILEGPILPAPQENQLYEITLEQKGGSSTGRPTGPILAKGYSRMIR